MEPVITHHIEIRPNRNGSPRAFIAGTRVRVQDIYARSEVHGESAEQIVAQLPHLSLSQVHSALAYYFDNREAILDELREDDEFASLVKAKLGPSPMAQKLKGKDADDAIPSG